MLFYKKIAAIVLLWVVSTYMYAQKYDNIWVVGNNYDNPIFGTIQINFNSGNPQILFDTKDIGFNATNATICDEQGNYLFCTNGIGIFDKNYDLMENGDSLNLGDFFNSFYEDGYPLPQGVFIIPSPLNPKLYYIFHQKLSYNTIYGKIISGQYYSIVDIQANGGLGKVLQKNILIKTGDFQVSTAIKHGNGRDWWIILPDCHQQIYSRFLLDTTGISSPIEQNIGFQQNYDAEPTATNLFSPDGTKFIDYDNRKGLSIFNFDRCSGLLSNEHWLPQTFEYTGGGAAISPNSRYLYTTGQKQEWNGSKLFQYDLFEDDITTSKKEVSYEKSYTLASDTISGFSFMQLAPNGKIYITGGQVISENTYYWHIIDQPDLEGVACNVVKKYNGLIFNNPVWGNMPIYPNYRLYDSPDSPCDSLGIDEPPPVSVLDVKANKEVVSVFPNPANESLTISSSNFIDANFTLFDVQSRVVLTHKLDKLETTMNTQSLPQGLYFWKVQSPTGVQFTGKVVIIH
jgi:Secretion system C-terminal sorting domain